MNRLISSTPLLHHRFTTPYHHKSHHNCLLLWRHQILDPDSDIVTTWQYVFLCTSILALFIDPLYFFLPSVVKENICMQNDTSLSIAITFFRTITDLFYLLHMVIKFRTAFVAPSSKVFGRGELVMDPKEIAMRYLKSDFVIDLAATLPLPQIVIWFVIPATKSSRTDHANNTLALIVLLQYIPRLFLIFPLNQRIIKTTGVVAKTAWAGAAYNLLLYMLASHILGSTWYLLSVGRQQQCWVQECVGLESQFTIGACDLSFLDCHGVESPQRQHWKNKTSILDNCRVVEDEDKFDFGIYGNAVTNDVTSSTFFEKYLYSLWWGLRNLSSYGQDLSTSTYLGETLFSIFVCILGLILLAVLIGNIQTYLQSMTIRLEEWRVKKRDTEEWMRHRQLPPDLQERVRRFVQYKWLATKGVNEESILRSLPLDLRREIQRHLCLYLVRRVPFFSQMDDQLLDAICERLFSSLSTQGTYIFREGDPVNEMLFIIRGQLESSTTNGGRSGFFNSITLRPGDFCGEELLTWALLPHSSLHLPTSTRTVRTLTEVEAFALRAEDLKFVAHQFKHLQSKKLQHVFRYYSHQWRTWGACYIQAAWRRFRRRKMAEELARQESFYYMQMSDSTSDYSDAPEDQNLIDGASNVSLINNATASQSLGTRLLSTKYSRNARGSNQKVEVIESSSEALKMPKLFKPNEPDFAADPDV